MSRWVLLPLWIALLGAEGFTSSPLHQRRCRMAVATSVEEAKARLLIEMPPTLGSVAKSTSDRIGAAAALLEAAAAAEDDKIVRWPQDLPRLDGRWRLNYSSNLREFSGASPLRLDHVYQVVNVTASTLKNVVYATARLPFSSSERKIDFALDHTFRITSRASPAQLEIVIDDLALFNVEKLASRSLVLPTLKPLHFLSAGTFDTTYLDESIRVSRGEFGELRVFTPAPTE